MSSDEKLELTDEETKRLKQFFKERFASLDMQLAEFPDKIGLGGTTVRKCVNQGQGTKTNLGIILAGIGIERSHPVYRRFVFDENIQNPFDQPNQILPFSERSLTIQAAIKIGAILSVILAAAIVAFVYIQNKADRAEYLMVLEEELKNDAVAFFQSLKTDATKSEGFEAALSNTINPELRVGNAAYGEVGILYSAFEAGNAQAMLSLMQAGASPHAYQKIEGTRSAMPFFLFPIHHVANNDAFNEAEKRRIIEAMLSRGAVLYEPIKETVELSIYQRGDSTMHQSNDALNVVSKYSDVKPTQRPLSCEIIRSQRICENAKDSSARDWCEFMNDVPAVIVVDDNAISDVRAIYIQEPISVSKGNAFFFATQLHGQQSINALFEALPETDKFRLHTYGNLSHRIRGHCSGEDPLGYCWRYFDVSISSENTAVIDDVYKAKTLAACSN